MTVASKHRRALADADAALFARGSRQGDCTTEGIEAEKEESLKVQCNDIITKRRIELFHESGQDRAGRPCRIFHGSAGASNLVV